MRKKEYRIISIGIVTIMMAGLLTACGEAATVDTTSSVQEISTEAEESGVSVESRTDTADLSDSEDTGKEESDSAGSNMAESEMITLSDNSDINITKGGKYLVTGSSKNSTIDVETEDEVEIVLDGVSMTNDDTPCIYVKNADKVTISTTEKESTLAVTGSFTTDGDTKTDAVIFSKDDIELEGSGTLNIESSDNAITSKDDLEVKGGILNIQCTGNALEAHDEIEFSDGTINITGCNDGLHAKDSDDETVGSVLITGGKLDITATDDAIHGTTTVQIDGGDLNLTAAECIEGTYITVNDGNINISASDDGINAAAKSSSYTPTFEMNGGNVVISMGGGDTDGVDSNGDIYINGGTIDITGQSTFDYDGNAKYNGGTIIENGTTTNTITNQFFGGMGGNFNGNFDSNFDGFEGGNNIEMPGGNFEWKGILINRLSRKEISNKDVKKFDKYVEKKCDLGYSTRKG